MWDLSGFLNYLARLLKGAFARSFGRHRKVKFDDHREPYVRSRGIYFAKDTRPDSLKVSGRDVLLEIQRIKDEEEYCETAISKKWEDVAGRK